MTYSTTLAAGFFCLPGTDTCIKLGGYLRVDTTFNGSVFGLPYWNGDAGQGNRYRSNFVGRTRMALTVNTRTATEYELSAPSVKATSKFDTFGLGVSNPAVNNAPGTSNALLHTPGGGYVAVEYAFIQFAGFTFGKSSSAYATLDKRISCLGSAHNRDTRHS